MGWIVRKKSSIWEHWSPSGYQKVDSAANIPYASEESVEEARNWVNEHEL